MMRKPEVEREIEDLARWIVEHGADRPPAFVEVGIPLYLPEYPPPGWKPPGGMA